MSGDECDGLCEEEVLRELARRGPAMTDAARSLAAGAVARGRMTVETAASMSPWTADDLRCFRPTGEAHGDVEVSVVVPAFNEELVLDELWRRLAPVLDRLGPSEVVIVDDGSRDGTWAKIQALSSADPRVRGIRLSRNFGHQAALSAGMAHARGAAVCCMDADLQDPPELLPDFVARWREGNDVVYAVRRTRRERLTKRVAYRAFYRIYRRLANIDVPLDSGDFALLDRRVVDAILALPERNRFLRGLRSWVGFRHVGVEYDRDARAGGAPKYTTKALVRLALDGIVAFSTTPLRLASLLGALVALAGAVYIAVAIVWRLSVGDVPEGWTSIIAVILTVGGMQLLVVGLLGEYVARVYDETKGRPTFLVAETVGTRVGRDGT